MKTTELMIGDWVMDRDCPAQVICPFCDGMVETTARPISNEDDISPIPLTAEILEKNGFVYNALPFRQCWEQFGLSLIDGGNCLYISCGADVSITCRGVHELQHALRLCGLDELANNFKV